MLPHSRAAAKRCIVVAPHRSCSNRLTRYLGPATGGGGVVCGRGAGFKREADTSRDIGCLPAGDSEEDGRMFFGWWGV